jgi:hypothetical protein
VTGTLTQVLWRGIGVVLLILPLFSIPRWVGASDPGPVWSPHVRAWIVGAAVVLVVGVLVGRLARALPPQARGWPAWGDAVFVGGLAALLTIAAAYTMRVAFASNPHLVDEVAQLFQARVFSSGRLAAPPPQLPEYFLFTHTWVTEAGWVSQFPPAHAVVLAIGMLFRAEWLVNPMLGGASVVLVFLAARGMFDAPTARVAAALWGVSAWVLFMSATYMNHALAVALVLGAWACVWAPGGRRTARFVAAGVLLGAAAATRPLDAVAGALPLVAQLGLNRRTRDLGLLMLGGLPVALALGYYNWRLFGGPLDFGYTALWGEGHRLGFHADAWGYEYTPLVGLTNMVAAIRRLHIYLFEWPIPALLPLGLWALVARRREAGDLALGLGVLAGPALYFFYWHSGFYPGPRFYYIAAPFLVIGTARALAWAWVTARSRPATRIRWDAALAGVCAAVLLWSWVDMFPRRFEVYRTGLPSLKYHPERDLADRGVRQALVLVPESWGARIITDLWALGAPPGVVERVYRRLDACDLHLFATHARAEELTPAAVVDSLEQRYAAVVEPVPLVPGSPDPTLRLWPGRELAPGCAVQLEHDRSGFTLYGSLAWRNPVGLRNGIVFARDRFERNGQLLAGYSGWEVWRFAPPVGEPEAEPRVSHLGRVEELLEDRPLP